MSFSSKVRTASNNDTPTHKWCLFINFVMSKCLQIAPAVAPTCDYTGSGQGDGGSDNFPAPAPAAALEVSGSDARSLGVQDLIAVSSVWELALAPGLTFLAAEDRAGGLGTQR